ncbi:MAG TPA: hypothetical protein VHC42_08850 [Rhizomicrobium sp.]|nr:hypothetical protein [Rhizomicrobium sp.]
MIQLSRMFRGEAAVKTAQPIAFGLPRIGVVRGAIGEQERLASLATLFPNATFEDIAGGWPDRMSSNLHILIVAVEGASEASLEDAARRLRHKSADLNVVVALRDASIAASRRLTREGAADVLPAPVSETALAISLERLLASHVEIAAPVKRAGQVVSIIKAGGGVGATSLGAQAAFMLAGRGPERGVSFVDLDLQFGTGALYFDLADALTVADCIDSGMELDGTPFSSALTAHKSGVRLLAAPRDMTALESLTPSMIDGLVAGLRRDFELTLLDLPSVWTNWTNRALELSDRIVLVTHLSVPHVHLVRRQLAALALQKLDGKPLTLVGNCVGSDSDAAISRRAAERAIGRPFDVAIPEDRRVMRSATNQGLQLAEVGRNSKVEKAVAEFAELISAHALQLAEMRR